MTSMDSLLLASVIENSMKQLTVEVAGLYWQVALGEDLKAEHTVWED